MFLVVVSKTDVFLLKKIKSVMRYKKETFEIARMQHSWFKQLHIGSIKCHSVLILKQQ